MNLSSLCSLQDPTVPQLFLSSVHGSSLFELIRFRVFTTLLVCTLFMRYSVPLPGRSSMFKDIHIHRFFCRLKLQIIQRHFTNSRIVEFI